MAITWLYRRAGVWRIAPRAGAGQVRLARRGVRVQALPEGTGEKPNTSEGLIIFVWL
jgi:hypothetical protein